MSDIFSAISILLVFVTVAFDFFVKDSQSFIKKGLPDRDQETEVKAYTLKKRIIIFKIVIVLIFYIILFWLLLPKSIQILDTSQIDLWDFNVLSTFYILINFCLIPFIGFSIKYLIEIINA